MNCLAWDSLLRYILNQPTQAEQLPLRLMLVTWRGRCCRGTPHGSPWTERPASQARSPSLPYNIRPFLAQKQHSFFENIYNLPYKRFAGFSLFSKQLLLLYKLLFLLALFWRIFAHRCSQICHAFSRIYILHRNFSIPQATDLFHKINKTCQRIDPCSILSRGGRGRRIWRC